MLTLAAADTIGAVSATGQVVLTIFGMELNAGNEVYKILDQRQLTSSPQTVYTVPGSTTAFVKSMHAVNLGNTQESFHIFADGLAAVNSITPDIELMDNGWAVYDENGWQVYGSAVTLASIETDDGPTLVVVDRAQRRLLETISLRLDEMSELTRNQSVIGATG